MLQRKINNSKSCFECNYKTISQIQSLSWINLLGSRQTMMLVSSNYFCQPFMCMGDSFNVYSHYVPNACNWSVKETGASRARKLCLCFFCSRTRPVPRGVRGVQSNPLISKSLIHNYIARRQKRVSAAAA